MVDVNGQSSPVQLWAEVYVTVEVLSEGRVEKTFFSQRSLVAPLAPPQLHRLTVDSDMAETSLELPQAAYLRYVGLSHGPNRDADVQDSYWDDDPGYREFSTYP